MKNDARGDKVLVMTLKFTSPCAGGRIDLERDRFWREQLPPQTTNALLEVVIVISRPRLWKRIHREDEIDTGR